MAAKDREREYDFVEQPPEDFFCPVSFTVLFEPYQTRCCGNHLSEEAYQRLQGKPCPLCRNKNVTAMKDNFHKRKVLSLKVRCPHKAEGCEWQGELRSLEPQHLNTNSCEGECEYVNVDCPYACGERVQRRSLEEHKSQHCPLRPFTCQYCNHKATHQKVTNEHWPVCEKYPLPCPNECGEEIERQHLKGHLEQSCELEVIQCDFSYAGCGAQLQRRLMSAHMKEGMEAHLSLVAQNIPILQSTVQQQGDRIKEQGDQIEKQQEDQIEQQIIQQSYLIKQQEDQIKQEEQIKQLGDQIKQQEDQIKQQEDQIKQQEDQIKQQGDQIKQQGGLLDCLINMQLGKLVPPVDIVMDSFKKHKKSNDIWYSPPFYTHLGGYRMGLEVYANGIRKGKGTHVSVYVCLMKGEFDDLIKWPFHGKVIIQLKKSDSQHYEKLLHLTDDISSDSVCKPTEKRNKGYGSSQYISHDEAGGYLKDDKLVFCVSDIVVE